MSGRRAFAIVSVLVVMTGALLVASAMLFLAQTGAADRAAAAGRVQSRALAWSGLQAILVRLDAERERILDGEAPELDERYVIYETAAANGVVRLLPIGPEGEHLVPEAGRLDVNRADAAMLEATGQLDAVEAQAIVAARGRAPGGILRSLATLLESPDIDPETLFGPLEELAAPSPEPQASSARPLASLATVWSVEPAIQRDGRRRLRLAGVAWSEELERRLQDRFGSEAAEAVRLVLERGSDLDTEAGLFEGLVGAGIDPSVWPELADTFTAERGAYHFGRLDINTAPYEALVALPGVEPAHAAAIVDGRDDLTADERSTIAWPAIRGALEPAQYAELAGWITTRSWTWRLRLEAGEQDPGDPDAPLADAVTWEVVIDLCDPRARVAALRDVTLLPLAVALALEADGAAGDDDAAAARRDDLVAEPAGGEEAGGDGEDGGAGAGGAAEAPPGADGGASPSGGRRRIGRWTGS